MSFFLIEPFSAYNQPPRKKHPSEIAEEERMFYEALERNKEVLRQQEIKESLEANKNPYSKDARTFFLNKDDGNLPDAHSSTGATGAGSSGIAEYKNFNPNITLNFTSSVVSGHIPFNVNFTNLSTGDIGLIDFRWTFGDGTSSVAPGPTHQYTKTGLFEVDLTGSAHSNGAIRSLLGIPNYISSSN